ncbi:MAG: redoxin domain-containing protein [Chloroflexi bacterium]|nr:redoxin domain-containing protein [Chloroflexota bacterium]
MASVNDSGMSLLEQAEELLRAGKRQAALPLLAEYLQGHPNSARCWWLLSLAVTDLRQQIDCMERVLVIDPNYTPARTRLEKLERMLEPRPPTVPPFMPEPGFSREDFETDPFEIDAEPAAPSSTFLAEEEEEEEAEPVYRWDSSTPWSSAYLDEEPQSQPPPAQPAEPPSQPRPTTQPAPRRATQKTPAWFLPVMGGLLLVCLMVACIGGVLVWRSFQPVTAATPQSPLSVPTRTLEPTWTPPPTITPRPTFTPIPGLTPSSALPIGTQQGNQEGLLVGNLAPDFTLWDVDGRKVSLSSYHGQPVVLFFWATWCPYCRAQIESLKGLHDTYKDAGLIILAVDVDENVDTGRAFRAKHEIKFPILDDWALTAFSLYKGRVVPVTYFIDQGGRINHFAVGQMDISSLNLQARAILNLLPTAVP